MKKENIRAFMGISLRNPFYSKKENLLKAINLAKDFDELLIFVVDSPYRLSLQAFNNLSSQEARKIMLKEGKELKSFLIKLTNKFNFVKISSFDELVNEDYKIILSEMRKIKDHDETFLGLIKKEFTGTIISKLNGDKEKENLCIEFILEEVAMFCSLLNQGYSVRISKYPASKSIDYYLKNKFLSLKHIQIK
jgi:hypothetical protein